MRQAPPPDDRRIPLPPLPRPAPTPPQRSWPRGPLFATGLLLLAAATGLVWWRLTPRPPEPPLPADIVDAEVREVLERARQEVLQEPRSAVAWGRLALLLQAHLFPDEADVCYIQAAQLAPGDARWPYGRGVLALKQNPDQAVALLRQATVAESYGLEYAAAARLELADALVERGELDEAERLYRAAHERASDRHRAALGLGRVALARGQDRAAADWLAEARQSPCARKTATAHLAALARAGGDAARADQHQQEAADLPDDPPWPDPLMDEVVQLQVGRRGRQRRAEILAHQGRYEEAAQVYLAQLDREPTAEACVSAALNLARVGQFDRAVPLLRQAVQLDPDSAEAHAGLALVQFDRAQKDWSQTPGAAEPREWLGEVVRHARRATELKPDHAQAYRYWGVALMYLGQPAAAVEPLRRSVTCRPDVFVSQLALGEALLAAGQDQEAEVHLDNARRLNPQDPRPAQALQRLRSKKD